MNSEKLSQMYSLATERMHQLISDLYEDLHKDNGEPKDTEAQVTLETNKVIRALRSELDLIKTSVIEYYESNSR